MRPLAGQVAHQAQPVGAGRQHLAQGFADVGLEASFGLRVPGASAIGGAREVGHEEQVEVGQVVGQVFAGQNQLACQTAVDRHLQAGRVGQCGSGGSRLRHRADAADARHDDQSVERMLGNQNLLEAAVKRRADLRRGDAAIGDIEAHFEVAFDAIEGTDRQATAHFGAPFLVPGRISG
ncbi:MAG: hypothetical protein AW10_03678 [Candidatus Accumulibacter appositus]|uniref:Uncharacterized protein n=1 Tax=Candidatus Accumulibacter appositus TaxID=1454003 RepID=A0A011QFD6_9PROT|nr:MAG: hypothetical protein AW10_03678 [Candidatus Accumulibacter appositus]